MGLTSVNYVLLCMVKYTLTIFFYKNNAEFLFVKVLQQIFYTIIYMERGKAFGAY